MDLAPGRGGLMSINVTYECCGYEVNVPNSLFDDIPDEEVSTVGHEYADMLHAFDSPECSYGGPTEVTV